MRCLAVIVYPLWRAEVGLSECVIYISSVIPQIYRNAKHPLGSCGDIGSSYRKCQSQLPPPRHLLPGSSLTETRYQD